MQNDAMATEKLGKLMMRMGIPTLVAQIINVLYSIVDRIYLGHIPGASEAALTGVGVTFPILTLISAFSVFVGSGGAPLSAISRGKGDLQRAEKILANSVVLLLSFCAALMLIFYLFMEPLLYLFGASDNTIGYGTTYLSIYLLGTVFVQLTIGLNPYIISQGASRTGMLSILIGAGINLILDPVFIFVLDMGVAGAAWATVIAQAASAIWIVSFLLSKRAVLRIRTKYMKLDRSIVKSILSLGISPFVMNSTASLVTIALNSSMQRYGGDLYVGSITILESMSQLINTPLNGFSQGVQPIISYNYGAGNFDRVREICRRLILICTSISFCGTMLFLLFPGVFASIFTNSRPLLELCTAKIPLFHCGLLLFGLQMGVQPSFVALGQARISLFLATLRKVFLLVPLALILPIFWGTAGVYIAEPISDITSALIAITLFRRNLGRILTRDTLNRI